MAKPTRSGAKRAVKRKEMSRGAMKRTKGGGTATPTKTTTASGDKPTESVSFNFGSVSVKY